MSARFDAACARFDASHAGDPRKLGEGEAAEPRAIAYHRLVAAWVDRLDPAASESLRLAARSQHIERWTLARDGFDKGRRGYLKWRVACGEMHADRAAAILAEVGYEQEAIDRVRDLLRKRRLGHDAEVQTLEDAACLTFLEADFVAFARRHDEAQVIDILRKTWAKMSPAGHDAALELASTLPDAARKLVERALAGD